MLEILHAEAIVPRYACDRPAEMESMSALQRMKRDVIFEWLRERIVSGFYPAGLRLPMERDLAQECSVARGTLRNALQMLEEEGFLERIRGQGTFVRNPVHGKRRDPGKVLSILVPCADYLTVSDLYQRRREQQYWTAILRAARECACRIETIEFSPSNSPDDVDWKALKRLNSESRVIISSLWYEKAFEFLAERHVKVALIRMRDFDLERYQGIFANWIDFFYDSLDSSCLAVKKLRSLGCRRIANAGRYVLDRYNNKTIGYQRALAGMAGMPEGGLNIDISSEDCCCESLLRTRISESWNQMHFDGLFFENCDYSFDPRFSLNRNLGIPEHVRIISFFDTPQNLQYRPQISALEHNVPGGFYEMTKLLLAEEYIPLHKRFDMTFFNRESTGGAYQKPPHQGVPLF